MTAKTEFPVGSAIWPGVSSVGGNADKDTQEKIRGLITELAEYLASALEQVGISRFVFPLFRPFNALFALNQNHLFCVISPLSGGVASLRFMDWRDSPAGTTLEETVSEVKRQLGWTDLTSFEVPATLLADSSQRRRERLRTITQGSAQQVRTQLLRKERRVTLRPIFRTQPEDMELDETLCFVLMPFQPPFDRIYKKVLVSAIREGGLKPLRADEIFTTTPIVEEIWSHIATARLVIADVTGRNANVFYELGLAHAVGKPVIILTQSSEDVPFDIAYIRYFTYTDDERGWAKLREDLARAIETALAEPAGVPGLRDS